jgi:hypothetical protein
LFRIDAMTKALQSRRNPSSMPHADSPAATATATPTPTAATATVPAPPMQVQVLLAPVPQLSGDGQLRELIQERRERSDSTGAIWYLPPELVAAQGLGQGLEAVVTPAAAVCTWLQLRFGGCTSEAPLTRAWLDAEAGALPPAAPQPRLS